MRQRRGRWLTAILCLLFGGFFLGFLLLVAVVTMSNGSCSAGGTLANGRSVMLESNSWHLTAGIDGDTFTGNTAGHTILIVGDDVTVDNELLATLDPAVKNVVVHVGSNEIALVADGQTTATCPR